jgi:hypothetical protein
MKYGPARMKPRNARIGQGDFVFGFKYRSAHSIPFSLSELTDFQMDSICSGFILEMPENKKSK